VQKSKKIEDTKAPEVSIQVGKVTDSSIEVTVQAVENESGLPDVETYEYCIGAGEAIDGKSVKNTYEYKNGLQPETEYILTVKVRDKAGNEGKATVKQKTDKKAGIPTTDAYVGYYADFEGDGTPDGIIYADLAIGNTGDGQWTDSDGNYTIPVEDNLKNYYISETKENGPWGEKYAVIPKEGTGNDRFYVMALSDIDASTHYWYKSANGKMSIDTSQDFGTGKQNTQTMINQWTNGKYLPNDDNDMWGLIQNQVEQGWFVPSRAEWSAFAEELKIKKGNYVNFGLSAWYWSSSQFNTSRAYLANFLGGCMYFNFVSTNYYVRLSATF